LIVQAEDPNLYAIGERHGRYIYHFRCPACGACGDLGVPKEAKSIACPEECSALFVQWFPPNQNGRVALRCINESAAKLRIELEILHRLNGARRL
jgi:hypothetical protein